jgi:hypothetical protein
VGFGGGLWAVNKLKVNEAANRGVLLVCRFQPDHTARAVPDFKV